MNGEMEDKAIGLAAKLVVEKEQLKAECAEWRAWADEVRKYLNTYMSSKRLDELLASAPDQKRTPNAQ